MPRWLPEGWLGKLALAAWAFVALVGLGSLALNHTVPMPGAGGPNLARAMLQLREGRDARFVVHVIYSGCSCTERLFTHLLRRGPFPGVEELVLFVGEHPGKREAARAAGFRFESIGPDALGARFGLEAAPVLVAFDAQGRLRYAGGYFDHPSTIFPLDERIHAAVVENRIPAVLPLYGCAVSPRLQRRVDPLGLVYRGG